MRQKKKIESSKLEPESNQESCVKCSKMQNGRQNSFDEPEIEVKQTTLSTLKSVLKRGASNKKVNKSSDKSLPCQNNAKDGQIVGKKTKNRVQFDESQNKYFEADYVILIHEEDYDLDDYYDEGSPYDDEDDDGYDEGMAPPKICCSNPNCNNTITLSNYSRYGYAAAAANGLVDVAYGRGDCGVAVGATVRNRYDFPSHYYDPDYEEINQNTRKPPPTMNRCENEKCQNCHNYFDFETPVKSDGGQDYGEQVTLSPPEGYKDGGMQCCQHHHQHQHQHNHSHHHLHHNHHHNGLHFHSNVVNDQRVPICRNIEYHEGENQSDEEGEEEDVEQYQKNENSMDEEDNAVVEISNFDREHEENNVLPEENDEEKTASDNLKKRFIVETITMTTVTEQRIVREASGGSSGNEEVIVKNEISDETRKGGILKGGKFWKNSLDKPTEKTVNYNEVGNNVPKMSEENENSDEGEERKNSPENQKMNAEERSEKVDGVAIAKTPNQSNVEDPQKFNEIEMTSPESAEFTLTFKLGQLLLMTNSLKPNSAMRQLFPSPKFVSPPPLEDENENQTSQNNKLGLPKQLLVTAENLRLFEEAKKSKIPGSSGSDESDQSYTSMTPTASKTGENVLNSGFLKTIERNTLRRNLIKCSYKYRNKMVAEQKKNENSLEERIRQLTCVVDDEEPQEDAKNETKNELENARTSPQGEESKNENQPSLGVKNSHTTDMSATYTPTSLSSGSGNSAYRKLTDLFSRKPNVPSVVEDINRNVKSENANIHCDLVLNSENLSNMYTINSQGQRNSFANLRNFAPKTTASTDAKKPILSTLGPLTACVNPEEGEKIAGHYKLTEGRDRYQPPGRESEYSIQDIEDGLKNAEPKKIGNQPDVIAETPQNETPSDELALFVQQDSGRMEKLKKKYSATDDKSDDDDDYGFNKRPLVKGIQMSASNENHPPVSAASQPPQQQQQQPPVFGTPVGAKPPTITTTANTFHPAWPDYSSDGADPVYRQFPITKKPTEHPNNCLICGNPQEYKGYPEASTNTYIENKGMGQQRINYLNQSQQQNIYATTNTFYRCHPVRFSGYSELPNYQFRHPPHSPPPMRRIIAPPKPSPIPLEDYKVRVENRVYVNRNHEIYSTPNAENCSKLKVAPPDGSNAVSPPNDGVKTPETMYNRQTVPNVRNPYLQMKFSPVNYHQGVVPTASIRFSASCAPPSLVDESTFPHIQNQNTVGLIRVEQGQQMIRVPVPYATGTPVQVHLMTSRFGRCDSPQKPSSPQNAIKVPLPPYNQYLIAKGMQTTQPYTGIATGVSSVLVPHPPPPPPSSSSQQVNSSVEFPLPNDVLKTVDFEKQGKAIAEELQQRHKLAISRTLNHDQSQNRAPPRSVSPTNALVQQERGVPEGAASSTVPDCQMPPSENSNMVAATPENTVYYTMNI